MTYPNLPRPSGKAHPKNTRPDYPETIRNRDTGVSLETIREAARQPAGDLVGMHATAQGTSRRDDTPHQPRHRLPSSTSEPAQPQGSPLPRAPPPDPVDTCTVQALTPLPRPRAEARTPTPAPPPWGVPTPPISIQSPVFFDLFVFGAVTALEPRGLPLRPAGLLPPSLRSVGLAPSLRSVALEASEAHRCLVCQR